MFLGKTSFWSHRSSTFCLQANLKSHQLCPTCNENDKKNHWIRLFLVQISYCNFDWECYRECINNVPKHMYIVQLTWLPYCTAFIKWNAQYGVSQVDIMWFSLVFTVTTNSCFFSYFVWSLQRNLTEYFVAVDVNNMLHLYASMLYERRILICCSKLSTVSRVHFLFLLSVNDLPVW